MKLITASLLLILSTQTFAESSKIKIKEVKTLTKSMHPESTCMDEYLKRRKELITKLALTPVVGAAGTVASTYVGGVTAVAIGTAAGAEGWDGLGYAIGGAAIGALTGVATIAVSATTTSITLANNALIVKALAEQHKGEPAYYSEKLYRKYVKHSKVDLHRDAFLSRLLSYDESSALCDGTMVKKPVIRMGTKLKYKVAKLKDLVRYMDAH